MKFYTHHHYGWTICAVVVTVAVALGAHTVVTRPVKITGTGTLNPAVTQATIGSTICKSGYSGSIRPPVSYTDQLKLVGIKQYGYIDTNPNHYQLDHAYSIEIGGSPTAPANLWPEEINVAHRDDLIENQIHKDICSGKVTLSQGQSQELQLKVSHGYKP